MTTASAEVAPITATDARALTDQIKVAVEATWELVKRAYIERAWAALGYDGWDDYCTREFGTSRLRLPREERSEVVASLRESGLSVRAIASATGLGYGTVNREIAAGDPNGSPEPVTGTDGKTYSPTAPKPTPGTIVTNDYIAAEQGMAGADVIECSGCETDHDPAVITELDTETLLCPNCLDEQDAPTADPQPEVAQQPQTPRRRPITEAFDSATFNLKRAVETVTRLAADDRLEKNKDQISGANLSDLIRVRDAINDVINTLEG